VLHGGDSTSHSKTSVNAGTAVTKKELTWLGVSLAPDLLPDPERAPEMVGNDVSEELIVGNRPTCHSMRWRTLEPLIIVPVVAANAGTATRGAIRGGVQSDSVTLVSELEE
jgi:hypothetical protein